MKYNIDIINKIVIAFIYTIIKNLINLYIITFLLLIKLYYSFNI